MRIRPVILTLGLCAAAMLLPSPGSALWKQRRRPRVKPVVLVFDLDGTVVGEGSSPRVLYLRSRERGGKWCPVPLTGGPTRSARLQALTQTLGPPQDHLGPAAQSYQRFAADGMTERAIFSRLLAGAHQPVSRARVGHVVDAYLRQLPAELERQGCHVLPGVEQQVLQARERGHAVVVGTGLDRRAAAIKLGRVGREHGKGTLADLLPNGGYGSDSVHRAELLRIGALRGAKMLGTPLADCQVVIVGDTLLDLLGAQANGWPLVGVGTGGYGKELEQAGVTVLKDLAQPNALDIIVAGGRL